MRRAVFRSCLLAGLLVFAQLGMMAHTLSHVGDDDHGSAGHPPCQWCTAYTPLGAGAPAANASTTLILPPSADAPAGGDAAPARLLCAAAYRVRAPPTLS